MAIPSGMSAQVGFEAETTYGDYAAPTEFLPLVSESMSQERERLESSAIIAGRRVLDEDMWNGGNHSTSGDLAFELYNRGVTTLFEQMFGDMTVTGSSAPYTYEFTPGDLTGKSLTVQVGRPGVKGVVHPFSYLGCKVASWEIACSAGEIATIGVSLVGQSEATSHPLASVTLPAGLKPFKFNHGSVKIGGSVVAVKGLTLSGDNTLAVDRRFIGTQDIAEPLEAGLRTYEGSLELEFEDLTQYNRFVSGAVADVEFELVSGADKVTVRYRARFDGETPNVGGPDILTQNLPIKAVGSTDAAAVTATIVTAEAPPAP